MNTYQKLKKLTDELFRRKTGIKRRTFERMVEMGPPARGDLPQGNLCETK